jgi:hypothetical protein
VQLSLSRRIVGTVILSVIIGSSAALVSSYLQVRDFNERAQKDVERYSVAVQAQLDAIKEKCRETAYQFALRPDVVDAVARSDAKYLQTSGRQVLQVGAINVLTIADPAGKVIGRGHSDKLGDSVLSQVNVAKARLGEATSGIEEGTVIKFSVRAGQPIRRGNQLVGTVTAGVDLSSDTKFVDRIKETMGVECTIFHADTRASTTIEKDGKRAIGTKMDNPVVVQTVLRDGKTFISTNRILGREYYTAYWPLRDAEGKVVGMLFIGKDRDAVVAAQRSIYSVVGGVVAGVLVLMGGAAVVIARSIAGPLLRLSRGLVDGTGRVTSVAAQVADSGKVLSGGASAQAAAVEESSASLEEMAAVTKQNAERAERADALMKRVEQNVGHATAFMTKLSAAMEGIRNASEESQKIVKTIDEIAFQTNLLALNAAVEAARAGEAGAGFAVVAQEVRNLAKRAAESARSTGELMEATLGKVRDGAGLMTGTREAFGQVAESAGQVAHLLDEIAASSREQSTGIVQVNEAVVEVDRVTQQNAANAEQSSSAALELSAQAVQMKAMVDELLGLVDGKPRGAGASREGDAPEGGSRLLLIPPPRGRRSGNAAVIRSSGTNAAKQKTPALGRG